MDPVRTAPSVLLELARRLAERGHVVVLARAIAGITLRVGDRRRLPRDLREGVGYFRGIPADVRAVRRLVRDVQPDVTWINSIFNPWATIGARMAGSPTVWHLHERRTRVGQPGGRSRHSDIDPTGVEVAADLTALPFPEAMFDAVYCSHVLEHVMDDRSAMHEVRRVLRPNGLAVVQVPLRNGETYEDGSITTPEGREATFGQHDHVRVYGRDIVYRLESSGFQVEALTASKLFDPEAVRRHGLDPEDVLFRCVRRG